jgi:uncharacterized membrane protein YkvA (DUF1232 family)
MKRQALRSRKVLKLCSSSASSDANTLTSISAGTPAGYCFSQIFSIDSSKAGLAFSALRRPRGIRGFAASMVLSSCRAAPRHPSSAACAEDLAMWKRMSVLWSVVKGDARMLWFALKHPQAPGWLKIGTAAILLYVISPVDLIPDVLPVVGIVDDLVIVPLAIRWLLGRLPAGLRDDVRYRAAGGKARATVD